MAYLVIPGVKWLPVCMALSVTVAAGVPYSFAVALKQVPPFIPFIRHAAAYLPQSGIFSIFITIAAFLGVMTFSLRYIVVKHRGFQEERLRKLNQIALFFGLLLNISLMYTGNNPLGFRAQTKHKWIVDVLVPHHIGAVFVCLCFNVYVLCHAYFTYRQKRMFGRNVFVQSVLAVCVVVSTWTALFPLYSSLKDELRSLIGDEDNMFSLEYKEYSFYSTICSLSEWSFTLFSLLFVASFSRDFEKISVRLHIKPKRDSCNSVEMPTLNL